MEQENVQKTIRELQVSKKLTWMVILLAANLIMMLAIGGAMLFGLLPKIDRAVQTTERVEARFQAFADKVQPVMTAGTDKAIEAIKKMDAERLSHTATEKTDKLIEAAAERAKRFLERDEDASQ